ncbi:MAG TPA: hypothetical protein VIV12_09380, partial [Streptosporangiaceae bacterium]
PKVSRCTNGKWLTSWLILGPDNGNREIGRRRARGGQLARRRARPGRAASGSWPVKPACGPAGQAAMVAQSLPERLPQ